MRTDVNTAEAQPGEASTAVVTKTQQITRFLLDEVGKAAIRVGDRLPSRSALAKEFGVSNSTASIALNELGKHVPLEWVPGKGFFLVNPRISLFKVAVIGRFTGNLYSAASLHDTYWHPLFLSLQAEALRQGTTITWIPDTEREPINLEHVLAIEPDCVVSFALAIRPETCFALRERHVTFVSGNRQLERLGISYVDYNAVGAFAEVARIFHGNGHRRIGVLAITVSVASNLDLCKNLFIETLVSLNCLYPYHDYWRIIDVHSDETKEPSELCEEGAYRETLSLLDLPEPPTALYCWNTYVADGAARAIRERGLIVGRDVSLLITGCREDAGPYSMLAEPHAALAAKVLETAKLAARNPHRVYQVLIPKPYVDRGSVVNRTVTKGTV